MQFMWLFLSNRFDFLFTSDGTLFIIPPGLTSSLPFISRFIFAFRCSSQATLNIIALADGVRRINESYSILGFNCPVNFYICPKSSKSKGLFELSNWAPAAIALTFKVLTLIAISILIPSINYLINLFYYSNVMGVCRRQKRKKQKKRKKKINIYFTGLDHNEGRPVVWFLWIALSWAILLLEN